MSTGIGGLIVAHMIMDDLERHRDLRSARRAGATASEGGSRPKDDRESPP